LRLGALAILLQCAAQTCLAGTVQQFGSARLYVSVDDDGVTLFSNIRPLHDDAVAAPEATRRQQFSARRAAARQGMDGAAAPVVVAGQDGEPDADAGADANPLHVIPPELRDGGQPPDDH
jgi:hypothetical protein